MAEFGARGLDEFSAHPPGGAGRRQWDAAVAGVALAVSQTVYRARR